MRILTRSEEYVLLTVWRLQEDAYSLEIRKTISDITGYEWSLGSIYTPLERLEKRGMLTSRLSRETPERGGRKKRIYRLTSSGRRELAQIRTVGEAMWAGLTGLLVEG